MCLKLIQCTCLVLTVKRYVKNFQLSTFLFYFILFFIWKINSLDGLAGSTILSNLDSKYLVQLNSYLDPVRQTTGRSSFVRCWHAKTDSWAASTFHRNCDGKGPTVTIVQVGSYIFGGYTDKSWGGMYQFITALMTHRSYMFSVSLWTGENDSNTLRVGAYFLWIKILIRVYWALNQSFCCPKTPFMCKWKPKYNGVTLNERTI